MHKRFVHLEEMALGIAVFGDEFIARYLKAAE
jgi:hypothetical protein